jgi:hypothetical protein
MFCRGMPLAVDAKQKLHSGKRRCHQDCGPQSENDHFSSPRDVIVTILAEDRDTACLHGADGQKFAAAVAAENLIIPSTNIYSSRTICLYTTLTFRQGINHKD